MCKICYVVTISLTVEAFFIFQLKYLAASRYDVTVVCSYDEKIANKFGDSIRYYLIDLPRGVSICGSISAIRELVLFRKEQFDLIQYSTPNAAFYVSIAAKWLDAR